MLLAAGSQFPFSINYRLYAEKSCFSDAAVLRPVGRERRAGEIGKRRLMTRMRRHGGVPAPVGRSRGGPAQFGFILADGAGHGEHLFRALVGEERQAGH
jgi:hypothetical protein